MKKAVTPDVTKSVKRKRRKQLEEVRSGPNFIKLLESKKYSQTMFCSAELSRIPVTNGA